MEQWRKSLYLEHHGIKGMHWGVRRTPEQLGHKVAAMVRTSRASESAYRTKLANIAKNKSADPNDVRRFKYRNRSLARRVGTTAAGVAANMVLTDALTGQTRKYGSMSKRELASRLGRVATATAANVAFRDAMAKSVSRRYTDSGRKVRGVKDRLLQKEDWMEVGMSTATHMAPFLTAMMKMRVSQIHANRIYNEEIFKQWGGRILEAPVADIVADAGFKVVR